MRASNEVRVVLTAAGLGTRVHHWARYLPKEFYPVGGRPGIAWILEEIAGLGAGHVVIVYHELRTDDQGPATLSGQPGL